MSPKKNKESEEQKAKTDLIPNQHKALFREIHYGAECIKRHEENWRRILTTIAEPRMRMELEYAMHHFERSIDDKDFEISLLLDELQAAEYQYFHSVCSHVDDIDRIIILCHDQIADLWRESANMINKLYDAAMQERADVGSINSEHEEYLKTMLFSLQENSREVGKLMRGDYLSRQQVEKSRLNEIAFKCKDELEVYYKSVWKEAETFIKRYKDDFSKKRMLFEELNEKDKVTQINLAEQWKNSSNAYENVRKLQIEFDLMKSNTERKIKDLTYERDFFENIANRLKTQFQKEMKDDSENLKHLSIVSLKVIKYLEEFAKKGDRLLVLCEVCRKLETLEEKTLNFPNFDDFLSEEENRFSYSTTDIGTNVQLKKRANKDQELKEFKLFWFRVGQIESQKLALAEEVNLFKYENAKLKEEVFKYCQCLNCDQKVKFFLQNQQFISDLVELHK